MHWTNLYWKWKIAKEFFNFPDQALYINVNIHCQICTSFGSDSGRGCNKLMQNIMSKTSSSKPKYSPHIIVGWLIKRRCRLQEHDVQSYQVPLQKMTNSYRIAETRWSVIYTVSYHCCTKNWLKPCVRVHACVCVCVCVCVNIVMAFILLIFGFQKTCELLYTSKISKIEKNIYLFNGLFIVNQCSKYQNKLFLAVKVNGCFLICTCCHAVPKKHRYHHFSGRIRAQKFQNNHSQRWTNFGWDLKS
jgi:uncharacterized membrane protein